MDVIIAIGHDGAGPDFSEQVRQVIARFGILNAVVSGPSWSPEWGTEDATWFAATFPYWSTFIEARARILAIGGANGQDAIAFTVGDTDVAECPTTQRAREYRDLL